MIKLQQVSFSFKKGKPVFVDVDLEIRRGEFVVVTGPSGSGKTTLIRLLQMELLPDSGVVSVGDYSSDRMNGSVFPHFKRRLGVIHQDFRLVQRLTVYENVALALRIRGLPEKEIKPQVLKTLREASVSHAVYLYPGELSGGEKQKVALARAIIGKPLVLLADEPTALMDQKAGEEILDLIRRINIGGTTVVMASHRNLGWDADSMKVMGLKDGIITPAVYDEK